MNQRPSHLTALLLGLLAVVAATWVRGVAVQRLPPDYDEFAYLPAAFRYAERMVPGRWSEIADVKENEEHPPLVKLAYGVVLKQTGAAEPEWDRVEVGKPIPPAARPAFTGPRTFSAVTGVLQVLLEALVSPLGALWLAFDTYHAKYTAQAYIEGLPGLFAILAVLLFERALRQREPQGLVPAPAPALAAAAAGRRGAGRAWPPPASTPTAWCCCSTFLPFLVQRGHEPALAAGRRRRGGAAGLPGRRPVPLERHGGPALEHRGLPPPVHADRAREEERPAVVVPALLPDPLDAGPVAPRGLRHRLARHAAPPGGGARACPAAARHRPVWLAWAVVGLLFLLAWPTKWPQYTLLARPPLTVLAGLGLVAVKDRLLGRRLAAGPRSL